MDAMQAMLQNDRYILSHDTDEPIKTAAETWKQATHQAAHVLYSEIEKIVKAENENGKKMLPGIRDIKHNPGKTRDKLNGKEYDYHIFNFDKDLVKYWVKSPMFPKLTRAHQTKVKQHVIKYIVARSKIDQTFKKTLTEKKHQAFHKKRSIWRQVMQTQNNNDVDNIDHSIPSTVQLGCPSEMTPEQHMLFHTDYTI